MFELKAFSNSRELCDAAAMQWIERLALVEPDRPYTVALSGGRVATDFYQAVCRAQAQRGTPFPGMVHFFWADERCVSPDSPDSNFKIAQTELFGPLGIEADRIHRIQGELPRDIAAERAEAELKGIAARLSSGGQPVLDMIFLGMGEDGHTASLFPEQVLEERSAALKVYAGVVGQKPPPQRVTLTYESIIAAAEVWAIVTGNSKTAVLVSCLQGNTDLPFGRVLRKRLRTIIWTDAFFAKNHLSKVEC